MAPCLILTGYVISTPIFIERTGMLTKVQNLWNQFNSNDEDLQPLAQWEDTVSNSIPDNERPL
jgi:hypothetical protein